MITASDILSRLPPYRDEWVLVKEDQYVADIISDMIRRHKQFEKYYDRFSYLFHSKNPDQLAEKLFKFCQDNIAYKEEPKEFQTTSLPTGLLIRGFGDCKHFAGFCAGVIDSLNRICGTVYEWCYLFAGYDGAAEPYHVYVGLFDPQSGEDIWIDPTPGEAGEISVLLSKRP